VKNFAPHRVQSRSPFASHSPQTSTPGDVSFPQPTQTDVPASTASVTTSPLTFGVGRFVAVFAIVYTAGHVLMS
jgi:hypothetical protein